MPIGSGIVYNTGDLILSQVSSSGTAFLETKIAAATSSLIYFDSTARINSASLNSITVGTASYVSGSTSIITNLTASNISASGTGSFGYIGIGTTIPNSKLEVAGTAGTGVVSVTNTGNGRSGSFGIDGNGVFIRNSNDGDYFDLKNASGTSRFRVVYDNNTYLNTTYTSVGSLTASGSKLSVFGNLSVGSTYGSTSSPTNGAIFEGKVGIGTTSLVTGFLDVRSNTSKTATATNVVFFGSNDASNPLGLAINHESSSGVKMVGLVGTEYGASGNNIKINEILHVQYNGNVGIGTTAPGALLEISSSTAASLLNVKGAGGNGLLFVSGSGNVGIGTTVPSAKLTIVENTNGGTINLVGRTSDDTAAINFRANGDASTYAYVSPDTNEFRLYHNDGFMSFYPGGSEKVRITSTGLVGIGTTSVNHKLDVWGATGTTFNMANTDDVGRGGKLTFISSSAAGRQFYVGTNSSIYNLVFGIDSIEKMRLDINGNLGIGTTSPAYLLDVSGSSRHGYRTSDTHFFTGSVNISGSLNATASWASNALTASSLVVGNSYTITNLTASNISASGTSSFGYVGIGTNSPIYKLDVQPTSSTVRFGQSVVGAFPANPSVFAFFGHTSLDNVNTAANYAVLQSSTGDSFLNASSGRNIYFRLGNTDKMILNSSGQFGIGTTSPIAGYLDVRSNQTKSVAGPTNITFFGSSDGSNPLGLLINHESSSGVKMVGLVGTEYGASGNNIKINEALTVQYGGYVGIGTTVPTAQLHICLDTTVFSAKNVVRIVNLGYSGITGAQNWTIRGAYQYAGGIAANADGGDLDIIKSLDRNTILATKTDGTQLGNVGIGTTSPAYLLDVSGSSRFGYRTADTHQFTGSVNISGSLNATASWSTNALTASFLPVGTYNITSSWAQNVISASFATTAQTANALNTANSYTIAGLTNNGTLSQQGTLSMGSGYQILATTGTVTNPGISFVADTNTGFYTPSADNIGIVTNGSEKVRIDSSGNVGIGTTNPTSKLHVITGGTSFTVPSQGNIGGSNSTRVNFVGSEPGLMLNTDFNGSAVQTGTGSISLGLQIGYYGSNDIRSQIFWAGNSPLTFTYSTSPSGSLTERMRIDALGNVGIGTNNPVSTLQVAGNISGSSFTSSISNAVGFLGTSSWANNVVSASYATTAQTANALNASNTYSIAGLTSAYVDVTGAGTIPSTGIYRPSSKTLGLSADATLILKINGSVSPYVTSIESGNVGIGSSSPSSKFEVLTSAVGLANQPNIIGNFRGDTDGRSLIRVDNTSTSAGAAALQAGISFVAYSNVSSQPSANKHEAQIILGSTGATSVTGGQTGTLQIVAPQDIAFNVSASNTIMTGSNYTTFGYNAMYISRTGNVGIGTTVPTARLHVSGSTGGVFEVDTAGGVTTLYVSASGNVGIGTTNPTAKLQVIAGNSPAISILSNNAGQYAYQYIGRTASELELGIAGSTNHFFTGTVAGDAVIKQNSTGKLHLGYASAAPSITIDTANNVGIGTTAPAAKLEISGSSNSALLNIKSPISGAILYVSGSGAVGIGTSNVGAFTLQVSGSFGATTKSFIIDHPTKAGKKLMYGSLESPYHGIRLTGRDTLKEGKCKVELPDYIYKLILHDSVNIQLTGIKCNKTLYVDDINIPENYFTIAYDKAIFESYKDYDFFWDFTAIRADVPELITEM